MESKSDYKKIAICLSFLIGDMTISFSANAKSFFDPALLSAAGVSSDIDLSFIEERKMVLPGKYYADIYLNNEYIEESEITFKLDNSESKAVFSRVDLIKYGVKEEFIEQDIGFINDMVKGSKGEYDSTISRYNLFIPQVKLSKKNRRLDKSMLDDGIPGLKLGYSFSGTDDKNDGKFLGANLGINFLGLRYKQNVVYNETYRGRKKSRDFTIINQYLELDAYNIDTKIMAGDVHSGASSLTVGDGFSFRGLSMFSNTALNPEDHQYSPVISGVAYSNSTVYVRQNGRVIYQENVPPGAFEFDNIGFLGSSGQVEIEIKEENGHSRKYTDYYNYVPGLLKPSSFVYEFNIGRAESGNRSTSSSEFGMLSLAYGLSSKSSLYGSTLLANKYMSLALGSGLSLNKYGSLSSDISLSHAENNSLSGASVQVRYAKTLLETGTSLHLSAYRYSTKSYISFNEFLNSRFNEKIYRIPRRRDSYEIRLNQSFNRNINLYVSGRVDNFWGGGSNTFINTGVNFYIYGVTVTSSLSIDKGSQSKGMNKNALFQLNIPFSIFDKQKGGSVSLSQYRNFSGSISNALSINGNIKDTGISWGLSRTQSSFGSNGFNSSLRYNHVYGNYSLGYSVYGDRKKINYNLSGGALAHQYGITLTSGYPDTVALIRTNGVSGISITNNPGLKTDVFGYAVYPYLSPYGNNNISIDPQSFKPGIDSHRNNHNVYPTAGAIMLVDFPVRSGHQVFFKLIYKGNIVPFGALVNLLNTTEDLTSIVGDNGTVYMGGIPKDGELYVQWGRSNQSCKAKYKLDVKKENEYDIKDVLVDCI